MHFRLSSMHNIHKKYNYNISANYKDYTVEGVEHCYLYAMAGPAWDRNVFKLGRTNDPDRRIREDLTKMPVNHRPQYIFCIRFMDNRYGSANESLLFELVIAAGGRRQVDPVSKRATEIFEISLERLKEIFAKMNTPELVEVNMEPVLAG